jgi:hypothetical protein
VAICPETAANVPESAPAGMASEAGADNRLVLLLSEIVAPPAGAALLSVAVQVLLLPEFRVAGLQLSEVSKTGSESVTTVD